MSYAVPVPCKITPQLFGLITPDCCCLVAKSYPTLRKSIDSTCQVLSMQFPRQEYWSGLPFPSPRDLTDPGIKPASSALAGGFFPAEPPGKSHPDCLFFFYTCHREVFHVTKFPFLACSFPPCLELLELQNICRMPISWSF